MRGVRTLGLKKQFPSSNFLAVAVSLSSLPDPVARALTPHQGRSLFLTGLTSLSDAAAEALAKHPYPGLTGQAKAAVERFRK